MGREGDPLRRVSGSFCLVLWLMVCVGVARRVWYSFWLYTYIIVYETVGCCFVLSKRHRFMLSTDVTTKILLNSSLLLLFFF
jgi:hypothetical protein